MTGGGQLVVSALNPAGPWSTGMRLSGLIGIDPDLAWDETGACYVSYCPTDPALPGIAQARVDLNAGTVDDFHWCELRIGRANAVAFVRIGAIETSPVPPVTVQGAVATLPLRAESLPSLTDGPDDIRLSVISNGFTTELARLDGRNLSTEVAGGFTGRVIGVRAVEGSVRVLSARYSDLDSA